MKNRLTLVIGILIVTVLLSYMFLFQVAFNENAVLTTFGKAGEHSVKTDAGLMFRLPPPIQQVHKYPTRVQILDDPIEQRQTADGFTVLARSYVAWRITDPHAFFVKLGSVQEAEKQLGPQLREVAAIVGEYNFAQLVNTDESQIKLREIEQRSRDQINRKLEALGYGIVVEDVGIRRLLLPETVTATVFGRMRDTRQRMAQDARSQGEAQANAIVSQAEAARRTILAFADSRAEDIRNEGRRQAAAYYREFAQDEEFAIFLRRMDALRDMLKHNTTFVLDARELSPLDIFNSPQPPARAQAEPSPDQPGRVALDPALINR